MMKMRKNTETKRGTKEKTSNRATVEKRKMVHSRFGQEEIK